MNKFTLTFKNPLLEQHYLLDSRNNHLSLFHIVQKTFAVLIITNIITNIFDQLNFIQILINIITLSTILCLYLIQRKKPNLFNVTTNFFNFFICLYSIAQQFQNSEFVNGLGTYNTQLFSASYCLLNCCVTLIGSNFFLNISTYMIIFLVRLFYLHIMGGFKVDVFISYLATILLFAYTYQVSEKTKRERFVLDKKEKQKDQILEKVNQSVAIFTYNLRENAYNLQFKNQYMKKQHNITGDEQFRGFLNQTQVFKSFHHKKSIHDLSFIVWEMFNQVYLNFKDPQIDITLYFYKSKTLYKLELSTAYDKEVTFLMIISNMSSQFQIHQQEELLKHYKQVFINSTNKWVTTLKSNSFKGQFSSIQQILYSMRSLQILLYNKIKRNLARIELDSFINQLKNANQEAELEKIGDIPEDIVTNRYKLWFILQTLIINAVRYSNDNKVEIEIIKTTEKLNKEYYDFKIRNKVSRMKLITKEIHTKFQLREILKDKCIKLRALDILVEDIGFGLKTIEESGVFTAQFSVIEGLDREHLKSKKICKKMKGKLEVKQELLNLD